MVRIREMRRADLPQVAQIYIERLTNSTYARLGPSFVRGLLSGIAASPYGCILVAESGACCGGFIAAATDVKALFRWLKWRRGLSLLLRALPSLLRRPRLIRQLSETSRYFGRVATQGIAAELLYIGVRRDLAASRPGHLLLADMLHKLRLSGVCAVKVTCEEDNKSPQNLLHDFGFEKRHTFDFYGKRMILLVHPDLERAGEKA